MRDVRGMKSSASKKTINHDIVISGFLCLISIINIFTIRTYTKQAAIFIGVLLITLSILLLLRNRRDKKYILLFGIMAYINISIFISDILSNGAITLPASTLNWQWLRNTDFEIYFINSLLCFNAIINFIDSIAKKPKNVSCENGSTLDENSPNNRSNIILFLVCYGILLIGLFTGYRNSSTAGTYLSATSTLYEYCIIISLFAWYYAGNKKSRHALIIIYAILYVIQAIIYGDRSSAFPMIMLMVLLYFKQLSIPKIAIIALVGILASNIIATYRESYTMSGFSQNYIARYGLANIASDTVSQSYYTGISKTYVRHKIESPESNFDDYLIGLIVGGKFGNSDITTYTKKYAYNSGGGFIVSDFYFWFGYFGTVIEAIIVGIIIIKLKEENSTFTSLWKICITTMVFRWYLYSSFVLFRSCIIIFLLFYLATSAIHKVFKDKFIRSTNTLSLNGASNHNLNNNITKGKYD